jgi:hypothetical protein
MLKPRGRDADKGDELLLRGGGLTATFPAALELDGGFRPAVFVDPPIHDDLCKSSFTKLDTLCKIRSPKVSRAKRRRLFAFR